MGDARRAGPRAEGGEAVKALYRGFAADVSLLIANGHFAAEHYPLGRVWIEAEIVRARIREAVSTEAILLHAAIVQVISGKKVFEKALKELHDGG